VGPTAGLEAVVKRKISILAGSRTPGYIFKIMLPFVLYDCETRPPTLKV
jgi:hypothetical protein